MRPVSIRGEFPSPVVATAMRDGTFFKLLYKVFGNLLELLARDDKHVFEIIDLGQDNRGHIG